MLYIIYKLDADPDSDYKKTQTLFLQTIRTEEPRLKEPTQIE